MPLIGLLDQLFRLNFLRHKEALRVVIPRMATDIYFKGFFNPRELEMNRKPNLLIYLLSYKTNYECNTEGTTPPESFSTKPQWHQLIPKDEGNEDEDPFRVCLITAGFVGALPGGH